MKEHYISDKISNLLDFAKNQKDEKVRRLNKSQKIAKIINELNAKIERAHIEFKHQICTLVANTLDKEL